MPGKGRVGNAEVIQKDAAPLAVSLVIPGRNVERTLGPCLDAVCPLLQSGKLKEIIFVNDASIDRSADIASRYPVCIVQGVGAGPATARNLGWRAARSPWIWFIDADCIAEADALDILVEAAQEPSVAAVSGSYSNAVTHSTLACLIHEEIVQRHLSMSRDVDYLATFNVLYRRELLEMVGGFDEYFKKPSAEDAEISYRISQCGMRLLFDIRSRVQHFHATALGKYLRVQARHGYYRMWMYMRHPERIKGDAYSGTVDHIQPPLAMMVLISLPLLLLPGWRWLPLLPAGCLLLAQIPMTRRLVGRAGPKYFMFAPLSFIRSFARGLGMTWGMVRHGFAAFRNRKPNQHLNNV